MEATALWAPPKEIATLDKVSYLYPGATKPALKDLSFTITKGEFFGVIGPTGAGKSTLCLAFNGIVPQFYGGRFFGRLTVAGRDTLEYSVSRLARSVGAVFEDPEVQLTATSVENEIAFALENLCISREEILDRIPRVLAAVRLEGYEQKNPQELSGGQKQRLAIAAALALQPDLLILDEPTSQLDPVGTQEVFATVKELNKSLGVTVVMVSHAAEEMAEYADRLGLLSEGSLAALGTPNEIYGDIETLTQNQLRPPEVAQTFYFLKQKGLNIPEIPVTLSQGLALLPSLQNQAIRVDKELLTNQDNHLSPPRLFEERGVGGEEIKQKPSPVLSVQNLKHTYSNGTQALHGVSLDIHQGEYVVIIGQNGAGKSTLVKHFLNLLQPTEGKVLVNNHITKEMSVSDLAKSIGYVAQNPDNQIFNTTVEKEVAFALRHQGFPAKVIEQRTAESLQDMGLWEERASNPLSLPKGARSRIVIAAILAMKPDIIIFDEPTTGQDYQGCQEILKITRDLHQRGKTIIVITHHLYLMPEYAQRAIVMGKGTILLDAPLRVAYHKTELLQSTYLTPPQAVRLAQKLSHLTGNDYPLLTPLEISEYFNHQMSS